MIKQYIITFIISLLLLASCKVDSETEKIIESLNTSCNYDGKKIEIEGYIFTDILENKKGEKVRVKLHSSPIATKGNLLISDIYLNECRQDEVKQNCIIMIRSKHYKPSDLNLVDKNGQIFGLGKKIKIEGTVNYISPCSDKGQNLDGNNYLFRVDNVTFEKK